MSSLTRLGRDLRGAAGWIITSAVILGLTAGLIASFATFAFSGSSNSVRDTAHNLSGFRVIDPQARIGRDVRDATRLPATAPFLDALGERTDLSLVLGVDYLTQVLANPALARVGALRVLISTGVVEATDQAPPGDTEALYWGSPADLARIGPTRLGTLTLLRGSGQAPAVAGATTANPVLWVSPAGATALGLMNGGRADELARSIRCACSPDALDTLTAAMNTAEDQAHTGRRFEAVAATSLPRLRSGALSDALALGLTLTTLILGSLVVAAGARRLRERMLTRYRIEFRQGARAGALRIRMQVTLTLGVDLPLLTGYTVGWLAYLPADWPPLLPPVALAAPVAVALILHVLIAVPNSRALTRAFQLKGSS